MLTPDHGDGNSPWAENNLGLPPPRFAALAANAPLLRPHKLSGGSFFFGDVKKDFPATAALKLLQERKRLVLRSLPSLPMPHGPVRQNRGLPKKPMTTENGFAVQDEPTLGRMPNCILPHG